MTDLRGALVAAGEDAYKAMRPITAQAVFIGLDNLIAQVAKLKPVRLSLSKVTYCSRIFRIALLIILMNATL